MTKNDDDPKKGKPQNRRDPIPGELLFHHRAEAGKGRSYDQRSRAGPSEWILIACLPVPGRLLASFENTELFTIWGCGREKSQLCMPRPRSLASNLRYFFFFFSHSLASGTLHEKRRIYQRSQTYFPETLRLAMIPIFVANLLCNFPSSTVTLLVSPKPPYGIVVAAVERQTTCPCPSHSR